MAEKPTLSFWQIWNIAFGFFGIQFGFALQNANSSRILQVYGADVEQLSLFWLAAPLTGMIVQPIIGYYSDRTWCCGGRRRPYFLLGAVFSAIALILLPNAGGFLSVENASVILSPIMIAVGMLILMDASFNISMEPMRALIGDMLPEKQYTTGYSMQTFLIGLGAVIASWLPSILNKFLAIENVSNVGQIAPNVKYSFYIGAAVLLLSILWSVIKTKEFSPEELASFEKKGKQKEETKRRRAFSEIMYDFIHMPKVMWQLGISQFFAWFALYSLWVYATPAVAEHIYQSPNPHSVGYANAADKVGELFGIYNFVAMLFALWLIPIARRLGRNITHAICLCIGGIGMISFYYITNVDWLILSMILIGIGWASILAMPYAILSRSLPAKKMGTYIGIFNFFITLPQIVNGLSHGWIMRILYDGHPIYALVTGAFSLFTAAIAVLFISERRKTTINI